MSVRSLAPIAAATGAVLLARRRLWASVIVRDLLGPEGGPTSTATAINDDGCVVGWASGRGYRWERGRLHWLTGFGWGSRADAIDAEGTVVGGRFSGNHDLTPMRWSPRGEATALPLPGPGWIGSATGTAGGVTVGWCQHWAEGSQRIPWSWRGDEGRPLDATDSVSGEATAAAEIGSIVGWITTAETGPTACLWPTDGSRLELPGGVGTSRALAINGQEVVVGMIDTDRGRRAAVWSEPTSLPVELDTLGGLEAEATGISDAGLVVGWSLVPDGFRHACVWEPADDGRYLIHDLGTLGGKTSEATAVNRRGQVVGTASTGRGAINAPLRPGGWSWEDHAFITDLDAHRP